MKSVFSLTVLLLLASIVCHAQDTAKLTRTPYKLTVLVDKKNYYSEDIKATPYVLPDNSVQLYPGEKVFIEVEQENGVIKSLKAVKENIFPEKTLIIEFTQTADKNVHQMMTLKITNPFKQTLVYSALMYPLKARKWVETDVLPVPPGIFGMETWPDVITSIALMGWSFKAN